jgi:hypothetical protein
MKAYFEYRMTMGCGFPSVKLEGEKRDWEDMRERVEGFARYGDEPAEWAAYLRKALDYMVASFDRPDDQGIKDFWMRACHAAGSEGSGGVESLSGWITAFCFWGGDGKKIFSYTDEQLEGITWQQSIDRKRLLLDGVSFPIIRRKDVPKAIADAPMRIIDLISGMEYDTSLIAGSVGMVATSANDGNGPGMTTFQPRSGWWMLLDKARPLI